MPNAAIRILIVGALCIAALIGLVVREGAARAAGQEVMLLMEPVDPRSILSGHYVVIDLRTPAPANADHDWCANVSRSNNTGWVALAPVAAPDAAHEAPAAHTATRHLTRPADATGQEIAVRGAMICFENFLDGSDTPGLVVQTALRGVERFHIDQSNALRIERLLTQQGEADCLTSFDGCVFAIVSIGGDGRARLRGLSVDGERLMLDWL